MQLSVQELEAKARQINDEVFGPDHKRKRNMGDAVKEQVNACAKFALEKALSMNGISGAERSAFLAVLKEQKDAINLLLVSDGQKEKAAAMLKPIFGYKSGEFIDAFQSAFRQLHNEVQFDMKRKNAA